MSSNNSSSDENAAAAAAAAAATSGNDSSGGGVDPTPSCPPLLLPHRSDDSLLEPFRYIGNVPGKDVRGKLIDCFQLWFQVDDGNDGDLPDDSNDGDNDKKKNKKKKDVLQSIKDIVASLHNASLLIDDIEDNSQLRRGVPVAHKIFGVPAVINCANYAYFLAMEECHALSNPQATQVFLGEILNLHRGQGQDIAWREAVLCPTEAEYLDMVRDKTGGLFRLAVGLLRAFAPSPDDDSDAQQPQRQCRTIIEDSDLTRLVNNLAVYFQIRDDYINLADEEYMKSKSFCEDLTEGKFSFPIIHCIRQDPADTRLVSILKQRTEDVDVKRYAQGLLKEAGSLTYARDECRRLKDAVVADISAFGGNPPLLKLIETLDVQLERIETMDNNDNDNSKNKNKNNNDADAPGGDGNSRKESSTPNRRGLDIDEA